MQEQSAGSGGTTGQVFDIQRFSVHDGPGIRTTVFLKGCSLRCVWCANPESQVTKAEILYWRDRCDCCGLCLQNICPDHALSIADDPAEKVHVDRAKCTLCGLCVDVCPVAALQISGRRMAASEVLAEVLRDEAFYRRSGGGMTLSGGEPLLQLEFAVELLRTAQECGINTAVETCGYVPWRSFELALPYVDLVFFDLKHVDGRVHDRVAGADNLRILGNLERVVKRRVNTIVRIPVIPGVNDSRENVSAIGRMVAALEPRPPLELMPYHRLGVSKYGALGREYQLPDALPPTMDELDELRRTLADLGLGVLA